MPLWGSFNLIHSPVFFLLEFFPEIFVGNFLLPGLPPPSGVLPSQLSVGLAHVVGYGPFI